MEFSPYHLKRRHPTERACHITAQPGRAAARASRHCSHQLSRRYHASADQYTRMPRQQDQPQRPRRRERFPRGSNNKKPGTTHTEGRGISRSRRPDAACPPRSGRAPSRRSSGQHRCSRAARRGRWRRRRWGICRGSEGALGPLKATPRRVTREKEGGEKKGLEGAARSEGWRLWRGSWWWWWWW